MIMRYLVLTRNRICYYSKIIMKYLVLIDDREYTDYSKMIIRYRTLAANSYSKIVMRYRVLTDNR